MQGIGGFFKNIKNAFTRELSMRLVIQSAIKKHAGIDVRVEDISLRSGTATLKNVSGAARSVIFIKKAAILAEINTAQSIRKISDIR